MHRFLEPRSCVKVEVDVQGLPVPNSPYGLFGCKATLNEPGGYSRTDTHWLKHCQIIFACYFRKSSIRDWRGGAQDGHLDFHTAPELWLAEKRYGSGQFADRRCLSHATSAWSLMAWKRWGELSSVMTRLNCVVVSLVRCVVVEPCNRLESCSVVHVNPSTAMMSLENDPQ